MPRLAWFALPLLAACAAKAPAPIAMAPATPVVVGQGPTHDGTPIETVPFRSGVSSATVERLARQAGCTGKQGAGLVSEPGPVEVYRLRCDDGRTFLARCELRQCVPMPR
ncbi:hypothetical protein [Pseudoduganella armeniaca]|uniref:Lipoprotein n=1 Tax=Pseudoduganella armeniaca TaxID=2072590 RepID=A0A2R4CEL3_9BURK|nr:hypothetical protein [Pseudoduganella armeniaca]AVR98079.1 hypothetical protein C9I28_22385 [Pseudoduganella armeniaca]